MLLSIIIHNIWSKTITGSKKINSIIYYINKLYWLLAQLSHLLTSYIVGQNKDKLLSECY